MATRILMPKLGLTMTEGMVSRWLKDNGEPVREGEPLVEVMTEKITFEVEAKASGLVHTILPEGSTVPVGKVIGYLLAAGEQPPAPGAADDTVAQTIASGEPSPEPVPAVVAASGNGGFVKASPMAKKIAAEHQVDLSEVKGSGPGSRVIESDILRFVEEREKNARVKATPLAQKMASEAGVDLRAVAGSGTGGRIVRDDVLAATGPVPAEKVIVDGGQKTVATRLPFAGMRKVIGERMSQSIHGSAQLTINTEADVTDLVKLRQQLLGEWKSEGLRLTYTDLVIKAAAKSLREHPRLNATLTGTEIEVWDQINVGMAVALDEGLIVPVIHGADTKTLKEIAQRSGELADKARANRLAVEEVTGGTFTITTLGMYDVDVFTPIINLPECAILGVGRVAERPAIFEGELAKRSLLNLSLTIDHRVIDGAPAAAFLKRVKQILEQPYLLFV